MLSNLVWLEMRSHKLNRKTEKKTVSTWNTHSKTSIVKKQSWTSSAQPYLLYSFTTNLWGFSSHVRYIDKILPLLFSKEHLISGGVLFHLISDMPLSMCLLEVRYFIHFLEFSLTTFDRINFHYLKCTMESDSFAYPAISFPAAVDLCVWIASS